mgnify:CR=1 FL=1
MSERYKIYRKGREKTERERERERERCRRWARWEILEQNLMIRKIRFSVIFPNYTPYIVCLKAT